MRKENFFWVSYADLMTSLFFIMMVLFVVTIGHLHNMLKTTEEQLEVYKEVESSLDKLKSSDIFKYDTEYKRYNLRFEVEFENDGEHINSHDLRNYMQTKKKLKEVGSELKSIVDELKRLKEQDPIYKNVSYLLVVTGYASKTSENYDYNYNLSYKRAYYLYKYWKNELGIDFDSKEYHSVIEFQIAGMGFGGVGRFPYIGSRVVNGQRVKGNTKNQRFIINIIPKIGDIELQDEK